MPGQHHVSLHLGTSPASGLEAVATGLDTAEEKKKKKKAEEKDANGEEDTPTLEYT